MKTKTIVPLFAMLMASSLCQAQNGSFWQKANAMLTKPAEVDTAYVYQPKASFSLGLFSTGQQAGFDVKVDFDLLFDDGSTLPCLSTYNLSENLCKKVGLEVGYGNIGFGYGLEVGPRSAQKKQSFGLNIIGKAWGLHFNYFNISNPFSTSIAIGEAGSEVFLEEHWTAEELAMLRNLSVDGYYVFNNKRFAFPAAYKAGLIQRHTEGSWMISARYVWGSLYNSPEAAAYTYNLFHCFSTQQASVGGGYSANIVLWHKDPIGSRDQGLRNVTVNLTAMPEITFVNRLATTSYTYDEESNHTGEDVSTVWCYPVPNYIASAAASLTWNRFYFTTQFTYNRFFFRSWDALDASPFDLSNSELYNVRFRGSFHDWTLKGLLVYRF